MQRFCGQIRLATGLGLVMAVLGTLFLSVTPAVAGIGGSDTPTWPTTAAVGNLISTSVFISNTSTAPNDTENVTLTTLFVTPACADSAASTCLAGNEDPGVFKVLTAIGDAGTGPCADVIFDIGAPNPLTGEVALTPQSTVTLGSVTSGVNLSCQVNLQLRVFKVPTNPAAGPPFTTNALTHATLHGVNSGLDGSAGGSAEIVVSKGFANVASLSNPNANNVVAGTAVTDTAVVTHATGAIAPTGSVRFILCQPSEVNVNGCPGQAGTKIGVDIPLVGNSATSDSTNDTTTLGTYCWRARYLGDDNYNASNHTNATTECFAVIGTPALSILKTPKDGVYPPGGPVVFSIKVTNDGPGTATDVTVDDLLPGVPADLDWNTSSPGCVINGAPPSQALHCDLGDLANGASVTVTVSSTLNAGNPADCVAPPGIENDLANAVGPGAGALGAVACATNVANCVADTGNQSCSSACPNSNPLLGAGTKCTIIESDPFTLSITGPAGQIQGDVCVGAGGTLQMSGANFILGDVHFETVVQCDGCTTGPTGRVRGADGQSGVVDINAALVGDAIQACEDASAVNAAKACTLGDYTQSLAALASPTADPKVRQLTGAPGENVICVSDVTVANKTIQLLGDATTSFVINVKDGGAFTINGGKIVAVAPVGPNKVLYNVLGAGPKVSFAGGSTKSGSLNIPKAQIDGTLIAIDREIALAPGLINGQLCSNRKMDLVSGSGVHCPTP